MHPADVRLLHVHGVGSQLIDRGQVGREHVGVLVIFGGYVLFDCAGEGELDGFPEGYLGLLEST